MYAKYIEYILNMIYKKIKTYIAKFDKTIDFKTLVVYTMCKQNPKKW